MTRTARSRSSLITGVGVAALIIIWLAVVYLAAPPLGLYYETLAAWYTLPPLVLIYAYCASHRHRFTALLAVVATVVAVVVIGFAIVIPKATLAVAPTTRYRLEPPNGSVCRGDAIGRPVGRFMAGGRAIAEDG